MNRAFDKGLVIGAGLVIALLIVDAALSYKNTRELNKHAQLVTHTNEVLVALEDVFSTTKDAETGQRGYIITGETSYLAPYSAAQAELPKKVARAKMLTADNPQYQAQFVTLEQHISAKLQELEKTVQLRKTGLEEARQVILQGRGKAEMDAIRHDVSEMENEEKTLLRDRTEQAVRAYHFAIITGLLTTLLALVMFGGFIYLLRQNFLTRAKAAAVVHDQREWFRTTLASIGDAVIATNTDGRITFLNPIAQQLTGWNEGDACGLPLEDVFKIVNEQTHQTVENPATKALREGTIVGLANHTLLINKQGGESPIDDSASPIRNAEGEIAGVVLVFRDVAIRRQAEKALHERSEQLAEADKMKNEFLAMLAHELRNPLAPIQNALHLIRLQGDKAADAPELWAIMERQVESLVRLVDDLLDVSRITRGKIGIHKQPVDVNAIVSRAVESSRPLIDARRQTLEVSLPYEPMRVDADLTRMTQVLLNLLNNAAKYTSEGGHIWLAVERGDGEAVFRVRDNGVGIRPEMLTKVFDLFSQSEQTLDRAEGGLGIGLTLARRLTEMHGGSVVAFSDGPGKGSEFVVRIPLLTNPSPIAASAMAKPHADGQPQKSGGKQVLVVDDNRDAANTMALLLRKWGHEVNMAYDGHEAVAAAETHKPDLILLDIGLPGRDGYEVARLIRAQPALADTMIVALTGYGMEKDREQSKAAGFDEHIVKPVDFDRLRELLEILKNRSA
jgi:two-component system CheB/CheR fusion protein